MHAQQRLWCVAMETHSVCLILMVVVFPKWKTCSQDHTHARRQHQHVPDMMGHAAPPHTTASPNMQAETKGLDMCIGSHWQPLSYHVALGPGLYGTLAGTGWHPTVPQSTVFQFPRNHGEQWRVSPNPKSKVTAAAAHVQQRAWRNTTLKPTGPLPTMRGPPRPPWENGAMMAMATAVLLHCPVLAMAMAMATVQYACSASAHTPRSTQASFTTQAQPTPQGSIA